MRCPVCGGEQLGRVARCACGYDASAIADLEEDMTAWRRRRRIFGALLAGGYALLVVLPPVSTVAAALVGGGLVSAGTILWPWSWLHLRASRRRLRSALQPAALPPARVV